MIWLVVWNIYIWLHIYIYIWLHIYIYIHIYIWLHIYIYIHMGIIVPTDFHIFQTQPPTKYSLTWHWISHNFMDFFGMDFCTGFHLYSPIHGEKIGVGLVDISPYFTSPNYKNWWITIKWFNSPILQLYIGDISSPKSWWSFCPDAALQPRRRLLRHAAGQRNDLVDAQGQGEAATSAGQPRRADGLGLGLIIVFMDL